MPTVAEAQSAYDRALAALERAQGVAQYTVQGATGGGRTVVNQNLDALQRRVDRCLADLVRAKRGGRGPGISYGVPG